MANNAAPSYLPANLSTAAPGHRFSIYFSGWERNWQIVKPYTTAIETALPFERQADLANSLSNRQTQSASRLPLAEVLTITTQSTSPFATGLGIEHPVENGFAFLTPYGIPYLAGSGVKGVARRAAEDKFEVGSPDVNLFFGPEAPEGQSVETFEPRRGALTFWDVIPTPPKRKSRLSIEIMTPHHSKYLSGEGTPNDSEVPTPIPFLVIPQGWGFRFVITCDKSRLPGEMKGKWKQVVTEIFKHAADTFGFGAKTAVGYGALKVIDRPIDQPTEELGENAGIVWLDAQLAKNTSARPEETLRSKNLARTWDSIADSRLKRMTLNEIKSRLGSDFEKLIAPRKIYDKGV